MIARLGNAMKPRPSAAMTFMRARSSNSATMRGRMFCSRNHVSNARRRLVFSVGNKAGDSSVSPLVVRFKAELEKIREQVQNIE